MFWLPVFLEYEICKGPGTSFYFPVPWAANTTINHLISIDELLKIVQKIGFKQITTENVTHESLNWFKSAIKNSKSGPANPLGLQLVSGDDFEIKANNVVKNLENKNIEVFNGVFEK